METNLYNATQEVTPQEIYSKQRTIADLPQVSTAFSSQTGKRKWEGQKDKNEIMAENYPSMRKDLDIQIHEDNTLH